MKIFRIYTTWLQFSRALQIIRVLTKHAFREWFYRTKMGKRRLRRHPKAQLDVRTTPERVRLTIEELGPTYIKFGQILADRPDIISERFRVELKKLQSKAIPIDDTTAVKLIEDELNDSIDNVFAYFDHRCLAAASIGQVYQGRLHSGEEVIVKIQRPHIISKIKLDIYLMHFVAKQLVKNYPDLVAINVLGFISEFQDKIMKELDYTVEASNIKRFEFMFKNDPTVHIPAVHMEYSTRKLLIMEKIVGITPDNIQRLKTEGYDLHQVAVNGANALLKMILEEGFFHGDPHPGNLFVLPNNVVGFIDFGMVGVLRPREMSFLAQFCMGFVRRDTRAIASSLLTLCDVKFFDQTEDMEFQIDQILKQYGHLTIEEIDFSKVMQDCINLVVLFQLKIPSGIFMLAKSLATLQKFAGNLDPDIALTPIVLPYAKKLVLTRFSPRKVAASIYDTAMDYVNLINTLPSTVNEILYKIKEGTMHHQVHIDEKNPVTRVFRNIGYRMVSAILIIGVFVGSSILIVNTPERPYGQFVLYMSSCIIVILLLKALFARKK
jgi:Predicted unusual protein kinase